MCRLFETIKIVNGEACNIPLHEKRMNASRRKLFGNCVRINLSDKILVPDNARSGIIRCRVIYDISVLSVEFSPYTPARVKSLKMVEAGDLDYSLKYLDRSRLYALIDRQIADDILITSNGDITDSSYANIAFTDGEEWFTPDTPLLKGTMREYLLKNNSIIETRITVRDLSKYTGFRLINAMLSFDAPVLPVSSIIK